MYSAGSYTVPEIFRPVSCEEYQAFENRKTSDISNGVCITSMNLLTSDERHGTTVTAVVMQFSVQKGNEFSITPLNSPGGSTLQWGAGRDLLCLALTASCYC